MQIYFASPWFTPEQEDIHDRVLAVLDSSPHGVFSPRRELQVRPDDPAPIRRRAFAGNLRSIDKCDMLVAVTDYKDIGTIWECGYAYRTIKPILYYAETLGNRPFNLMLAESGIGVVRETEELSTLVGMQSLAQIYARLEKYKGVIE